VPQKHADNPEGGLIHLDPVGSSRIPEKDAAGPVRQSGTEDDSRAVLLCGKNLPEIKRFLNYYGVKEDEMTDRKPVPRAEIAESGFCVRESEEICGARPSHRHARGFRRFDAGM